MTASLFETVFGDDFEKTPAEIQAMHKGARQAEGRVVVERGTSVLAQLICTLAWMPKSTADARALVTFELVTNGERWKRDFAGRRFQTTLKSIRRGDGPQLTERFGPFLFHLDARAHANGIDLTPVRAYLFGVSLPAFLCPAAAGNIRAAAGKYCFDVTVRAPLVGEVIRYRGWLEPIR